MTRDDIITAYTQSANKLLTGDLSDLNAPRLVEALWRLREDWVDTHQRIEEEEIEWAVRILIAVTAARLGLL